MTREEAGQAEILYCYGFVPAGAPEPPDDLVGVGSRPVETLALDVGRAVISRVPSEAYDAEGVEARLRDLEWLAEQGLGHERVVTWFVDRAWILPARLLTLYSSPEALRREADERAGRIRAALDRMEGLYEWDLKISYDPDRLAESMGELSREVADLEEEIDTTSPGRGYLLGKVKEERVRSGAEDVAREKAEEVLAGLEPMASEAVRLALPKESGGDAPVVLGAALLAPRDREDRLRDVAQRWSEELEEVGIQVEFSGPWAPYRFLEELDDPPGGTGTPSTGG